MTASTSSDSTLWAGQDPLQPADKLEDVIFLFNPQKALDDDYLRF